MTDDSAVFTICILLTALVIAWQAAAKTIRWRLRKWIDRELDTLTGQPTYIQGYRDALVRLEDSLMRRKLIARVETQGEI